MRINIPAQDAMVAREGCVALFHFGHRNYCVTRGVNRVSKDLVEGMEEVIHGLCVDGRLCHGDKIINVYVMVA
jgi:hypothetical protein